MYQSYCPLMLVDVSSLSSDSIDILLMESTITSLHLVTITAENDGNGFLLLTILLCKNQAVGETWYEKTLHVESLI